MDNYEVKLMCSFDGTIRYLEPDNKICYVGGHTKLIYVNRSINIYAMMDKLRKICREEDVSEFKYQFPSKDDNILITVHEQDDLENMMREYDTLSNYSTATPVMRLFITPSHLSLY